MALKKINSINQFFKLEKDSWTFIGKKLEVYIPSVYEERGLLILGDTANSLGIFQLRINDTFVANFLLLSKVTMEFVSKRNVVEDDYQYTVLEFENGSTFIQNINLVKNANLAYDIFMTFIALGKIPPFVEYNAIQTLFDNDKKCCDISLGINHSVFEMIYAHMYRDPQDAYNFYRYTQMKKAPIIVPIHQISHGPISNAAKVIGSYMKEGLVAALTDEKQKPPSIVENLMRA